VLSKKVHVFVFYPLWVILLSKVNNNQSNKAIIILSIYNYKY